VVAEADPMVIGDLRRYCFAASFGAFSAR